jgi:hypothetical protein
MHMTLDNGWYTCRGCSYDSRFVPKNAAFNWHAPSKQWRTQDINKAVTLAAYADASCRDKLVAHLALMRKSVEASRAANADSDIPCPEGTAYLPFQRAGILYASTRPFPDCGCLFGDEMGLGKGLTKTHVLPTLDGMGLIMSKVCVGDYVIGKNGKPTIVKGVFPQ